MYTELNLQKFLRNGGSLKELNDNLHIDIKPDPVHPNLLLFKYDQLESPMSDPIVQECRGIILDKDDNWAIVSRAFDKFFNSYEGHAKPLDWSTARVQEKVDGSLMVLYPYKGFWRVASSGHPSAGGTVWNLQRVEILFSQYFWDAFNALGCQLPPVDCGHCFAFELTGPLNRVVVPHTEPRITLLGCRNLTTQKELVPAFAEELFKIGAPVVREFPLGSLSQIIDSFESISPLSQEGYVVVDGNFHRQKVKHPGYVAIHHARDKFTPRNFIEVIRSGETSEFVGQFPEYEMIFNTLKTKYDALADEIDALYAKHKNITVQKDFALAVKGYRCVSAIFAMRSGYVTTARQYLRTMTLDTLIKLLD